MNEFGIRAIVFINQEEHNNQLVFNTDDFIRWVWEQKNVELMRGNANALLRSTYRAAQRRDHRLNLSWYFE